MKICFFAKGSDASLLEDATYYSEDISILRELGHKVILTTKFQEIPWNCDLYFTWWYAWGFMTLFKSLLTHTPNIMVGPVHLEDPEFGFKKRLLLRQWSIRLSLSLADAAVAVSKAEYNGIQALGARRPRMAYHSVVAPQSIRSLSEREPLVLSIGHLDWFGIRRKRFDNVIRAIPKVLEQLPNIRFAIIGRKGPGFERLLELVKHLGVQKAVEFPGRVDNGKKAEYLQRARVMLQPACYEGFGLAQLEAMATGVPVVTTAVGAVEEVVGTCGAYCDKDNSEDMAGHVVRILSEPTLWANLSRRGRERAISNFSREHRKLTLAKIISDVTRVGKYADSAEAPVYEELVSDRDSVTCLNAQKRTMTRAEGK